MATKFRHRPQTEEEDASALKLGAEFNNAGCLLISEVKYLLENRDKDAPDTKCTVLVVDLFWCMVYNKTLEYVKTFTKFNTTDSASAVRDTLRQEPALTQFETAQIANLCPATADEAKSVIPSLVKIDDDRLEALLRDIQTMRKYQS
ncbi:HRDC-like protein [Mycena polygramma]|nr:HRDC-like protein [Mycena polygramma]